MYSFQHMIILLMAAIAGTQAVPHVSNVARTTTNNGPTILTGDKMGAAALTYGSSSTMIVYQAEDTSVQRLKGLGPPSSSTSYAADTLLAAGVARNDTPLAVAVDNQIVFTVEHLFYISNTECSGGNYLHELYNDPYHGWVDGPLNKQQFCSPSSSNFLYAIGGQRSGLGPNQPQSPMRVGYMRANDNALVEANIASGTWATAQF